MKCALGTSAFITVTFGIKMIPLVIVSIVINTAPFWAVILAWCLINEKITKVQGIAMILSFIGIGLVSS